MTESFIKTLSQIDKNDTALVGGKGASLGEMLNVGIPVPPGFVIVAEVYRKFHDKELPDQLKNEILTAFDQLGAERVAVRSSAVAEDSSEASWAGQLESYLNTQREDLLENIQKCWRSINSKRALTYTKKQNIPKEQMVVAVVVQKMVDSESAGVLFTTNPINKDQQEMMIESSYGLGETVVQGMINPDNFIVEKKTLEIKSKNLGSKEKMLVFKGNVNQELSVPQKQRQQFSLEDKTILELAGFAMKIENHYGFPCDIEWAKEGAQLFIVQSRPITTLSNLKQSEGLVIDDKPILEGLGASQGVQSGKVRIIVNQKDISKTKPGEILVAEKTSPDFIEAFGKVAAVVTDSGGLTSHAAIVSRELGLPSVVGSKDATKNLKNGEVVTVDGNSGKVYRGRLELASEKKEKPFVYKIEKSEDDITDMVNSAASSVLSDRELWPVDPVQLFTYIDFDQTYDFYLKLKSLIDRNWSFERIAKLFDHPTIIKFFIMNSASTGLKTAVNLKLAPITIKDNVQFFRWLAEILKNLTIEDPFSLEGKNIVWTKKQIEAFVLQNEWATLENEGLKDSINRLSVNLFTLCWSFFTDYFGADGCERHGPYDLPKAKFGQSKLLVRDFFDLKPEEIWPIARKVPFKSILLAQVYEKTPIYLNWGNALVNQKSLVAHNRSFALLVDGKPIFKKDEIEDLSKKVGLLAREQTEYVNALSKKDQIRKCAELSYYGFKKFYLHFSDQWYPKEKIENTFKIIGDKPLRIEKKNERSSSEKKALFDPRIPLSV